MKARNAFREAAGPVVHDRDSIVLFSAHTGLGMKECSTVFNQWLNKIDPTLQTPNVDSQEKTPD
jgi:hypothetical protein